MAMADASMAPSNDSVDGAPPLSFAAMALARATASSGDIDMLNEAGEDGTRCGKEGGDGVRIGTVVVVLISVLFCCLRKMRQYVVIN